MFKYIKLIIFILILLLISAAVIFIDSSTDNMNKLMPEISDGIVTGDSDYNEAVELVNNKNYAESKNKLMSAESNYNSSLTKLYTIRNNFTSDVNDVHKEYINDAINEVELKLNATEDFKEAISYFEDQYNYTGTTYALEANDYMYQSLEYRDARDTLVSENPNLFKDNLLFN